MSWTLRDDATIDTAIKTTRLPSPNAATSHVLSRMRTSQPAAQPSVRHLTAVPASCKSGSAQRRGASHLHGFTGRSPANSSCLLRLRDGIAGSSVVYSDSAHAKPSGRATMLRQLEPCDHDLQTRGGSRTSLDIAKAWERVIVVANRA